MLYGLAKKLKEARITRGLTQARVANLLDLTRSTISSYESGHVMPSVEVLAKLASMYQVSSDYLLGIDNKPVVVLDGLTKSQIETVRIILDTLMIEFKTTNLITAKSENESKE